LTYATNILNISIWKHAYLVRDDDYCHDTSTLLQTFLPGDACEHRREKWEKDHCQWKVLQKERCVALDQCIVNFYSSRRKFERRKAEYANRFHQFQMRLCEFRLAMGNEIDRCGDIPLDLTRNDLPLPVPKLDSSGWCLKENTAEEGYPSASNRTMCLEWRLRENISSQDNVNKVNQGNCECKMSNSTLNVPMVREMEQEREKDEASDKDATSMLDRCKQKNAQMRYGAEQAWGNVSSADKKHRNCRELNWGFYYYAEKVLTIDIWDDAYTVVQNKTRFCNPTMNNLLQTFTPTSCKELQEVYELQLCEWIQLRKEMCWHLEECINDFKISRWKILNRTENRKEEFRGILEKLYQLKETILHINETNNPVEISFDLPRFTANLSDPNLTTCDGMNITTEFKYPTNTNTTMCNEWRNESNVLGEDGCVTTCNISTLSAKKEPMAPCKGDQNKWFVSFWSKINCTSLRPEMKDNHTLYSCETRGINNLTGNDVCPECRKCERQ